MIQRMLNYVPIDVPDVDMTTVTDIEVCFEQKSTDIELVYSGDNITVANAHQIIVTVPKEDAMGLDKKNVRGQIMFTQDGVPSITEVFVIPVEELLKDDGYGD